MKKVTVLMFLFLMLSACAAAQQRMIPDDPFFKYQVSYDNQGGLVVVDMTSRKRSPVELQLQPGIHLQMTCAWAITTGSRATIVALLDDGFFYDQEDIRDNIWRNKGETGRDRAERTARAIRYAADNGARAINWSGFVREDRPEKLDLLREAIDYAGSRGVLLIVGAGNDARDIDLEENRFYPACFESDNIIVVAEVDFDGILYKVPEGSKYIGGSNYGPKNIDVAALAQNYTTQLKDNCSTYGLGGGTSDASPVVTGVAALVFSLRPDLSGPQVKEILMRSATKLPALEGGVKSAGMVNAWEALKSAAEYPQQ